MSDIPWTWSEAMGRHFIYLPTEDELMFRDGQRIPRPARLPVESLEDATYEFSTSNFSQSPPSSDARYIHSGSGPQRDSQLSSSLPSSTSHIANMSCGLMPREASSDRRYATQDEIPRSYPGIQGRDALTGRTSTSGVVASSSSQRQAQSGRSGTGHTADPQEDLAARMARVRVNNFPSGVLSRNPQDDRELIARVRVDRNDVGNNITGAEVDGMPTTELYPDYKARKRDFFFLGKVFSILWAEPVGTTLQAPSMANTSREQAVVKGPYGELIYSKIRRFVVIREGDNYCNALPISTYGGQGVGKKGVVKSEHAIIYTINEPAPMQGERPRRDELPMRPTSIRVDPDTRAEKLHPASRLNFGHPHTIQHNIKVKSCGKVPQESVDAMIEQFGVVFRGNRRARGNTQPAESSKAAATRPTGSNTTGFTADGALQAALGKLMDQFSREEAVTRMLQMLQNKGLDRDEALDMIRKALR